MKITNRTVIGTKNAVTYLEFQLQNVRFLQIYCDFFPCNGFCGGVHTKGNEPICKKKKKKERKKKKSANRRVGHKKACPQGKTRTIAIICEKGLLLPSKLLFANRPQSVEIKNFLSFRFYVKSLFGQFYRLKKIILTILEPGCFDFWKI